MRQMLRFLVGGGTAVFVDFITYWMLLKLQVPVELAKACSYILGASVGFIINKFYTFESKKLAAREIICYIVLYTVSAFLNSGTNYLVLLIMTNKNIAFLAATGVSTIVNFIGQKFFVFRK